MTSSGTYTFNPSIGELTLNAFARLQVRRPALLAEHFVDARMEANLLLGEWINRGVSLWVIDLQTQVLTQGVSTYTLSATTVAVLDAYIATGSDPEIDRIIYPVSRSEYAAFPDKETQGSPTVFWFDRLITPTLTVWQPPDDTETYTLKYYRMRQIQDANLPSGETLDVPYRFLDAFAAGLAHRLSRIYAPALEMQRKADAEMAWQIASSADVENTPLFISPGLSSYYR